MRKLNPVQEAVKVKEIFVMASASAKFCWIDAIDDGTLSHFVLQKTGPSNEKGSKKINSAIRCETRVYKGEKMSMSGG